MASDRNLINAAFAEAKTRVAGDFPDLTKLYQSTTNISKQYLDTVGGILKDIQEERKQEKKKADAQKKAFMTIANNNLQSLYENEEPLPEAFISMAEQAVRDMSSQFDLVNTIGDEDTQENQRARRQILAKLNKLTNELRGVRKTYMDRSDVIQNVLLSDRVFKGENIDLIAKAFDIKNVDKNVLENFLQVGYDIDDGVFFNVRNDINNDYEKILFSDVAANFNPRNDDNDRTYIEMINASGAKGELDGKDENITEVQYNEDNFIAGFKDMIQDEQDFDDFAYDRISGLNDEPSFEEAVYENAVTMGIPFAVLDQMTILENNEAKKVGEKYKQLDLNNDGTISSLDGRIAKDELSAKDLKIFKENVKQLIDAVVNKDNPAFNFEVSRDLMAKYYMTYHKRMYLVNYNSFKQQRLNRQNQGNKGGSFSIGHLRYDSLESLVADNKLLFEFLENPRENQVVSGQVTGNTYKYMDGKYYGFDPQKGDYTISLGNEKNDPTGLNYIINQEGASGYINTSTGKYHYKGNKRYTALQLNLSEKISGTSNVKVGDLGNMSLEEAISALEKAYGNPTLFTSKGNSLLIDNKTFGLNNNGLDKLWRYLTRTDENGFRAYYDKNAK
tara:strand:+ start:598 stop:2445 length:1848 start_codon:yes stop_codon:yes gene_type:complete